MTPGLVPTHQCRRLSLQGGRRVFHSPPASPGNTLKPKRPLWATMPTQCGTITVQEAFSAADLTTETCQITSTGPYNPGDAVRVEIGVRNDNPVEGTATVVLLADESQIASGQITVGANTSASTTLSGSLPTPSGDSGSFNIVTEVSTATKGDSAGDNPSLPGDPGLPFDNPGNDPPGNDPPGNLPRVTPDSRRGSGSTTTSGFDGVY